MRMMSFELGCHGTLEFPPSSSDLLHFESMTGPSALSTARPAPTDPGLIRAGIADRHGQWCGAVDLNVACMNMVGTPLEFLLIYRVSGFSEDEIQSWESHLPDVIDDEIAARTMASTMYY